MTFTRVLIASFSLRLAGKRTAVNGMIEPLISYFSPKADELDLIDGPHPGSDTVITIFETYRHKIRVSVTASIISKILWPFLTLANRNDTQLVFKLRDLLTVFEWTLRSRTSYDLFIGLESVYTLAGILLKKLGKIKTVVYYVSDYSPTRYRNSFLNNLYLSLDRFCCCHADCVWDVSPAMMPARITAGLKPDRCAPVIRAPNALFPSQIIQISANQLIPYSLVYAGTFGPENGPQLAIKALPSIVKNFPKTTLHFIGSDPDERKNLEQLARQIGVYERLSFYPFVSDQTKLSQTIARFMIGLAPYPAILGSPRWYADATKIRLYLGAGLPVITTHVPPLGKEVSAKGAGLVVEDTPAALAKAVIRLFDNKPLYRKMRLAAADFARHNTWETTYIHAISGISLERR